MESGRGLDRRAAVMSGELELYIHIPFCVKKCNYCDFLSFPAGTNLQERYVNQLSEELRMRAAQAADYSVSSVFIGGGTPSVMPGRLVSDILQTVHDLYNVDDDAEITVECNPSSTMRHKFAAYRAAGVNRISIGLQSADNSELRMLGRTHSFEEFLKSYQAARMEGFDNINVDLINCIPMQNLKSWKKTLRSVLMLRPEHLSVYALMIEEGTPFHEMREKDLLIMPSEEEEAAIDEFTAECTAKYGYTRYEFSNYARPGKACRHNKGYWTGVPYLGFGIGAASFFGDERWKNIRDIERYMDLDFTVDTGLRTEVRTLGRNDRMEEFVCLGMRLIDGISRTLFRNEFGQQIENVFGEPLMKNMRLGMIELDMDRYRLTPRGIDVSNLVLSDFLLH